jgi:hypothetical protein
MTDLKVLALNCDLLYVDTAWFEEGRYDSHTKGQTRKLKDLVKTYLNAKIQDDVHSSVSDL